MALKKRKLWLSALWAALVLLVLASTLTAATYAWFTFDPYTNVTPMEGKISEGESDLLISESREGPFDRSCGLNPARMPEILQPVSTSDLTRFYAATTQDREGYSIAFREVSDQLDAYAIYGTVYLRSLGGCDVYFQRPGLDLGTDVQVLAAGRLGLRITGADGTARSFLFRLDALGNTAGAQQRQTVRAENAVVGGIQGSEPVFSQDPAVSIGDYLMDAVGASPLCSVVAGETAQVEYWLYLEGCDLECCNPVQSRDVVLRLGFAGKPIENETIDNE